MDFSQRDRSCHDPGPSSRARAQQRGPDDIPTHQGRVAQLVERSLSILWCMRKVLGSIPSSSKAS